MLTNMVFYETVSQIFDIQLIYILMIF